MYVPNAIGQALKQYELFLDIVFRYRGDSLFRKPFYIYYYVLILFLYKR